MSVEFSVKREVYNFNSKEWPCLQLYFTTCYCRTKWTRTIPPCNWSFWQGIYYHVMFIFRIGKVVNSFLVHSIVWRTEFTSRWIQRTVVYVTENCLLIFIILVDKVWLCRFQNVNLSYFRVYFAVLFYLNCITWNKHPFPKSLWRKRLKCRLSIDFPQRFPEMLCQRRRKKCYV